MRGVSECGNGYKTQDESTMKFLEKMQELNIPIIDLHVSRTRRLSNITRGHKYHTSESRDTNTYRGKGENQGIYR